MEFILQHDILLQLNMERPQNVMQHAECFLIRPVIIAEAAVRMIVCHRNHIQPMPAGVFQQNADMELQAVDIAALEPVACAQDAKLVKACHPQLLLERRADQLTDEG